MKLFYKFIYSVLFLISSHTTFSQNLEFQGTLVNVSPDSVRVYLRPNQTTNNVSFTGVVLVLSIPDQTVGGGTNPTVRIALNHGTNLGYISEFNDSARTIGNSTPVIQGGRAYYTFLGADANSNTINITENESFPIATFVFDRTGIADNEIQLNDLSTGSYGSGGGPNGNAFLFIDVIGAPGDPDARNTNVAAMFYGEPGTFTNNGGVSPSSVDLQPGLLPVLLKEFNVARHGSNSAILTWVTTSEQNVSHYILERSPKESGGYHKIAEVKAKGNSTIETQYTYTDANVFTGQNGSKVFFYRVRSIDLDGIQKVFPIRFLRFGAQNDKGISIYPNPVTKGFYVNIPALQGQSEKIFLKISNRQGQILETREISVLAASNYYYELKTPGIIAGDYFLQIIYDNKILDTKKIIVQR